MKKDLGFVRYPWYTCKLKVYLHPWHLVLTSCDNPIPTEHVHPWTNHQVHYVAVQRQWPKRTSHIILDQRIAVPCSMLPPRPERKSSKQSECPAKSDFVCNCNGRQNECKHLL